MAKKLNQTIGINLQFNSDTSRAKRDIESLQMELDKLVLLSQSKSGVGLTEGFKEATRAAAELSAHLQKAVNVKTGNLDFAKLNQSIKASGTSLQAYGDKLRSLGPDGRKAFMQLAQAVVQAEIPMRRASNLMKEFLTTLANTARWQLSSSILHGFMGTLQSAYGYAKDLNESLNNIRIVTGQSVDEMSRFAKEANDAAKALSTTTNEYAKASLIYYQQGLNSKEVKERTDVTIKLANVSRQSAEEVSDQMTAIWNNFANGSKELEYYADVLTALGAATASSTEEISGGLEKFAGVARTIGLSYEYAAAALATITSNTRQSEEVVGTALKTIFARIQGLNLGETLDDGTTLNKYSQALASVGINIMTANGQLKDMDIILDELGARWSVLTRAQQTALAQTVAGVRQYNQLMSLMANWNNGDNDSFISNLTTVSGAEGALQQQADIYAESWEAASDRVRAAAEAIYDKILDDDFFIDILNSIEKILGFVDELIDNLGGLKGILFTIGATITKYFGDKLANSLKNIAYNFQMMTAAGRKKVADEKAAFIQDAANKMAKAANTGEAGFDEKQASEIYEGQLKCQQKMIENAEKMNEYEKHTAQLLMDQLKFRGELAIKASQELENKKQKLSDQADLLYRRAASKGEGALVGAASTMDNVKKVAAKQKTIEDWSSQPSKHSGMDVRKLTVDIDIPPEMQQKINNLADQLDDSKKSSQEINDIWKQIRATMAGVIDNEVAKTADQLGASVDEVQDYLNAVDDVEDANKKLEESNQQVKESADSVTDAIDNAKGAQYTWSNMIVDCATLAMSAAAAINTLSATMDTLFDKDMEPLDKFKALLTQLPMLAMQSITFYQALTKVMGKEEGQTWRSAFAKMFKAKASKEAAKANTEEAAASMGAAAADVKEAAASDKAAAANRREANASNSATAANNSEAASDVIDDISDNIDIKNKKISKKTAKPKKTPKTGKIGVKGGASAGGMFAAVAVAAAIVTVAAIGISHLNKAYNKNEEAAKRAEAANLKLAAAYQEATQKYNDLNNTITTYQDAKKGLEELTRGTAEFAMQLAAANEEALKLIENYGLIKGTDYSIGSDGLIQINKEALERVKLEEAQDVAAAQSASIVAKQKAREARLKADATELNRKKIKSTEGFTNEDGNRTGVMAAGGAGAGALTGLAVGAAAGSSVPVFGTLIGAAAGLLIGGIGGAIGYGISKNSETDDEKHALELIAKSYEENGEAALTKEAMEATLKAAKISDSLREEISKNSDEVAKLAKEMALNTAAIKAEDRAAVGAILAADEEASKSVHSEDLPAFVTEQDYTKIKDAEYNKYMQTDIASWWFDVGKQEGKDLWAEYAKETGLDKLSGYKVTDYDNDNEVTYKYYENGTEQEKTVTLEEIAATLAARDAKKKALTGGREVAKILADVDQQTVKLLAGVKDKDMSKVTMGTLLQGGDYSNLSLDELRALGFEGANRDSIMATIQDAQNKQKQDLLNTANTYGATVGEAMVNLLSVNKDGSLLHTAFENVTQGTVKAYASTMDQVFSMGGESMMDHFNTMIMGIADNNKLQAEAIFAAAEGIDWSRGESALQDFNDQLLQIDIDIDETDDNWKNFIADLQEANLSVLKNDLNAIREKLVSIKKITKDVRMGDIISDEDYNTLLRYNAALADMFVMTADGYMYTGTDNLNMTSKELADNQLQRQLGSNQRATDAVNVLTTDNFDDYKWDSMASGLISDNTSIGAANLLASNSGKAVREALGLSAEKLTDLVIALQSGDESIKSKAREQLQAIFGDINTLKVGVASGQYDDTNAWSVYWSQLGLQDLYDELDNADTKGYDAEQKAIIEEFIEARKKALSELDIEEAERYHNVNQELTRMTQELNAISKLKAKAFGEQYINLLERETELLREQFEIEKQHRIEAANNLVTDRNAIASYGFTFDTDGNITNYDNIYNREYAAWVAAQQKNVTEDITPEAYEAAQERWEEFSKGVTQYEKTLTEFSNATNSLIDINTQYYDTLVSYYTETLSKASDELSKYTDRMEHYNTKLEHYNDLLILIGREADYKSLGLILDGQAELAKNAISISKQSYEMYKAEADSLKTKMDAVIDDPERFDVYKRQWEEAEKTAREAEDQMLSDIKAWGEAEKAVLENTLADLGKTLEQTLTGGITFDKLTTQMERAQSLQEDYLTTTNQIYETTKMMRTAQQAIDATSNAVAKDKLKQFITETKSMQEQGKLSQYELDMQQAKYDLLVAEIALQEAQNAKSTVRLQRDSNGNFGYVYTADAKEVSEAQQKFDDAQNALYNKGLEGANDYAQKYQQTMAEMTETLNQIQSDYLNGNYATEEEYQNAMAEAKAYYFEKLKGYSSLYGIALSADSAIVTEAWTTDFADMVAGTDKWNEAVTEYINGTTIAFEDWAEVVAEIKQTTGSDLDIISGKVNNVTTASEALVTALLGEDGEGGVLKELKDGFASIGETIIESLNKWAGLTVTVNDDGTFSITPKDPVPGAVTGGLTSSWGPEGKMLMVHESELILNKDQTNSFFEHLALMESMLSTLDFYALSQQFGGILTSPSAIPAAAGALEQNVKIEATFPNVQDKYEIEEAFNNLVNKASQYANRK